MTLPIYSCEIEDDDKNDTGILAMSFVEYPAVNVDFVALSKQRKKKEYLHLNKDKQILTGVVLRPGQMIYRNEGKKEYYITFSQQSIERIAQKMMRQNIALASTTHQHQSSLSGNYLCELWTISDPKNDKANALGFQNLPKGSLMCSYKITDSDYWNNEVKTGNVKGFSLEGFFYQNEIKMNKQTKQTKKNGKFLAFLKSLGVMLSEDEETTAAETSTAEEVDDLKEEAQKDETESATPVLAFDLADGAVMVVDADGYAYLNEVNGEAMPAGTHALADGNTIVIDEDNKFVETTSEVSEETTQVEPNAELAKAKKRGKEFLAKRVGANNHSPDNTAKIAQLEKEIAMLKKQPTAQVARPAENQTKHSDTHYGRMAQVAMLSLKKKFESYKL